jgi:hypothetical protein
MLFGRCSWEFFKPQTQAKLKKSKAPSEAEGPAVHSTANQCCRQRLFQPLANFPRKLHLPLVIPTGAKRSGGTCGFLNQQPLLIEAQSIRNA